MPGSKKTEIVNKLDEEIKKLLEAIKEDKYGLANGSGSEEKEPGNNVKSDEKTELKENNTNKTKNDDEPKLLN